MTAAFLQAFRQDIEAAIQFLEEGDYERITIQANRAISEAALWGDLPVLSSIGLTARMASIAASVALGGERLAFPQKQALLAFLRETAAMAQKPPEELATQPALPWTALAKFNAQFWAENRDTVEGKAYTPNPEFVDDVVQWAVGMLRESWQLLAEPTGSPLQGAANELDRVYRSFGATRFQLAKLGQLLALTWYADYADWQCRKLDESTDRERFRQVMEPWVNRVLESLAEKKETDEFYARAADTCHGILGAWRRDFAKYFDLFTFQERERTRIRIGVAQPLAKEERPAEARRRKK